MHTELSEREYENLIGTYDVVHFMGACSGKDKSKIIYLMENKIYLVDVTDEDAITKFESIQREEAKQFFSEHYGIGYGLGNPEAKKF